MESKKITHRLLTGSLAVLMALLFLSCHQPLRGEKTLMVQGSTSSQPPGSTYRVFQGEIILPPDGYWRTAGSKHIDFITELYLVPTAPIIDEQAGGRLGAVLEEKQTRRGRSKVQQLYWACSTHAQTHNNKGPNSIKDLDPKQFKYLLKGISKSPYDVKTGQEPDGPFVFLVPGVTFVFEKNGKFVKPENKKILAWELRPYVDDGKHYVLYTSGACVRENINHALMKKYKQTIRPIKPRKKGLAKQTESGPPEGRAYTITAVCKKVPKKPLRLTLENVYSGKTITIQWPLKTAQTAEKNERPDLAKMRAAAYLAYAGLSDSPVMWAWLAALDKNVLQNLPRRRGRRGRESFSFFDILGGRAAARETLQMQVLTARKKKIESYSIPLESLKGVEVKSHPFADMLKKNKGRIQTPTLANTVPHDRGFVYLTNPRDILGFLDEGCEFIHHLGTSFTGNGVDYGLDKTYLSRLGLNRPMLDLMVGSGALKECALFFPDLFFIDGTDITVLARLTKPGKLSKLLKITGLPSLPQKKVIKFSPGKEEPVYWALWDDLLMIGTNENELQKALDLKTANGNGSLGHSAEFRYMSAQLPLTKHSWGYVYLSDPFIRRLVGPEVKIGQLRRIMARAEMEYLTAHALLAKLDGVPAPWSLKTLTDSGRVSKNFGGGDYFFDADGRLRSKTWGGLSQMKPISQVPIAGISRLEQKAYQQYVERYSNYWRRYFDPMALRLDEAADGFLEAEVFILPLVDNTIYNSLKTTLKSKEDNTPLKIPRLSKDPVLMLSLNLGEETWKSILKGGYSMLTRYVHLHPAIFEDFGPGFHLAVHDADPVIALGSGDLLGIFGANTALGRGGEMISLPVILSVLTRPCTLIIETQNPKRTLNYLKQAMPFAGMQRRNREFSVRAHQVGNDDQWVFSFNMAGIIKLRFGVALDDRFLLIRNIPWSHDEKITATDETALHSASLRTFPDACNLQLPGLFEADQDRNLFIAFQGAGHLYPLLAAGEDSVETAAKTHAALFGFAPRHPGKGTFLWKDFHLESSVYGSVFAQRQPGYEAGDTDFGVLKGFKYLGVSMQFEDTGLRTKFRWRFAQ